MFNFIHCPKARHSHFQAHGGRKTQRNTCSKHSCRYLTLKGIEQDKAHMYSEFYQVHELCDTGISRGKMKYLVTGAHASRPLQQGVAQKQLSLAMAHQHQLRVKGERVL